MSRYFAPLNLFIRMTTHRAVAMTIKNISRRVALRRSIFSYELRRFAQWLCRTTYEDTALHAVALVIKKSHVASLRATQSFHTNYGVSRRGYVALSVTTRSHDDQKYLMSRLPAPLNLFIRITALRAVAMSHCQRRQGASRRSHDA